MDALEQELSDLYVSLGELLKANPPVDIQHRESRSKGRVEEFADGVARVKGLNNTRVGDRVAFPTSTVRAREKEGPGEPVIYGMIVDLDEYSVGCLVFGEERFIKENDEVVTGDITVKPETNSGQATTYSWSLVDAQPVRSVLTVPAGDHLLGRVIDPLGHEYTPGGKDIKESDTNTSKGVVHIPIERPTLGIIHRDKIDQPLMTGYTAIDSMLPIGRGQRMLLIGDRNTGKTSIALDTVTNQMKETCDKVQAAKDESERGKALNDMVYCVYVAIGKKASEVEQIRKTLMEAWEKVWEQKDHKPKNPNYIVVTAMANDPATLVYIAPFAGSAVAEYFRDTGRHALIIYDDLTRHAAAYRQISLILKRSPGREAYPGDVFYLHSRLLERACRAAKAGSTLYAKQMTKLQALAERGDFRDSNVSELQIDIGLLDLFYHYLKGGHARELKPGGSLTALPIIETKQSDYASYIPTNVISITDGQIYLDPVLFSEGQRPAVNVGISVSRVGKDAQADMMKILSKDLRVQLSQFRDKEKFAKYGVEDEEGTKLIRWGRMVMEVLKQGVGQHRDLVEQVVSLAMLMASQDTDSALRAEYFVERENDDKPEDESARATDPGKPIEKNAKLLVPKVPCYLDAALRAASSGDEKHLPSGDTVPTTLSAVEISRLRTVLKEVLAKVVNDNGDRPSIQEMAIRSVAQFIFDFGNVKLNDETYKRRIDKLTEEITELESSINGTTLSQEERDSRACEIRTKKLEQKRQQKFQEDHIKRHKIQLFYEWLDALEIASQNTQVTNGDAHTATE